MTNYSVLRHAVPLDEAAERYGTVRRGFMLCPFHADRVPSLKLYGETTSTASAAEHMATWST